jgi:hypothetical protein
MVEKMHGCTEMLSDPRCQYILQDMLVLYPAWFASNPLGAAHGCDLLE